MKIVKIESKINFPNTCRISFSPFKVGDIVRLTEEGLRNKAMVPTNLVDQGHENKFHITKIKMYSEYGDVYISFAECCEKKKNGYACTAHPVEYFEKVVK